MVDTGNKIAARGVDTGGKVATSINNTSSTGGKFIAGVIDTGVVDNCINFATGVVCTMTCEYLQEFLKIC